MTPSKALAALVPAMLLLALAGPALVRADDGCVATPTGIDCSASGTTTTIITGPTGPNLPLRYLRVTRHPTIGTCWYWATRPPGLDSWDSANDHAIIMTRWALPACPGPGPSDPTGPDILSHAWSIFRSFPLRAPSVNLSPREHGITGIESMLQVSPFPVFRHKEVLPDGTKLVVNARVTALEIDWGDGTPVFRYDPGRAAGGVGHIYDRKTCTPHYRAHHPAGHRCHPTLDAYPVEVTARWTGRYWLRGRRTGLGVISRSTTIRYDVDEIIGVPLVP